MIRRTPFICALSAAILLALSACSGGDGAPVVILYSSVDPDYLRPVLDAFEEETGVRVRYAGDTEATKTTGLATRLLEEHRSGRARADVWWSSEPFWTIRLADEGVLASYHSEAAEASIDGGWPASARDSDCRWYGFARRARVYVYNTGLVSPEDAPRTPADLLDPRFKGRIGMARPQFGTTRGHVAAMLAVFGEEAFAGWLEGLKANGVRLYDGNMSVVRAVSSGEIHVGLTDTDDVWAGQRNGWPIALAYESRANPATVTGGMGPLLMPNTIGLVSGGPNQDNARRFIDFALSARTERLLAESDSHNIPVHPDLALEFIDYRAEDPAEVDLRTVSEAMDRAIELCGRLLE